MTTLQTATYTLAVVSTPLAAVTCTLVLVSTPLAVDTNSESPHRFPSPFAKRTNQPCNPIFYLFHSTHAPNHASLKQ